MTYAEVSRRRAVHSVDAFLTAIADYQNQEFGPRDRHCFVRSDGIFRIADNADELVPVVAMATQLRDALAAGRTEAVVTELNRLVEADHALPFGDHERNYRGLFDELFDRSREYVEISTVTSPDVDGQNRWLKVSECAELLLTDVSGLDLEKAKARVSWAASNDKFRTNGKKRDARRIDRDSFSTWRLDQRERDLDAEDEGPE